MLTCLAMMENNLIDFLQARSLNNKRVFMTGDDIGGGCPLLSTVSGR